MDDCSKDNIYSYFVIVYSWEHTMGKDFVFVFVSVFVFSWEHIMGKDFVFVFVFSWEHDHPPWAKDRIAW